MKKLKLVMITLLLAVVALASFPATPAMAIADPDSPPQINAVYVYSFDDGSVGVLIDYTIDYAAIPTETATDAYLAVFVDTDGTTQLKSVAPYTFVNSGYGRGLVWIYFTAAEATTYGMDSADIANYRIWLTGNPTLSWSGDPPKTIGTIDQWNTTGSMSTLLALRVLYYADVLELAWTLDMVETTSAGNKLTDSGASYFENVISDLRDLAPACFADSSTYPDSVSVDYSTDYSAVATSGTAVVNGSPQEITEGTDTVTVTAAGDIPGTIVITLGQYNAGTITDDTGTMTGSPVTLQPGINTLTVTAAGDFTAAVTVADQAAHYGDTVAGTGLDMTNSATAFGTSRWMFSGLIWLLLTVIVSMYFLRGGSFGMEGSGKVVMLLFVLLCVAGMLLGLLHPLVVSLIIIAYGAFIGYVLFFRSDALHKGFMFMMWMFIITSIAGNFAASGQVGIVTTELTDNITAAETADIPVLSTSGFSDAGWVVIGDEIIRYPDKGATDFTDTTFNPIVRGTDSTDAAAHSVGDHVRTKESYLLNASVDYKIASIADSAGALGFLALPFKLLDLVFTFFTLPLTFLGTGLSVLSYIWIVVATGMIVGLVIAMVGGRRV